MRMDKKRLGGRIRLVVPRGPGDVVVREAEDELILRALSG
jgi:3-dehydroquinate synthetase